MKVLGRPKLESFWKTHNQAKKPLLRWLAVTENAEWGKFADIKKTYNTADFYTDNNGDYIIFNVGGNKYRIVTGINFKGLLVVIKVVMTHSQYSKEKWKG